MKVVMIRPEDDAETRTLSAWAARANASISANDDWTGSKATAANLRHSLRKNPAYELIAFYGHGEYDHLVGHSASRLIHVGGAGGVEPAELTGRNLYAVACRAGAVLGPALKAKNCHFVGYKEDLCWVPDFEEDFGTVVNKGLIAWATQEKTSEQIESQLKEDWALLRKEAMHGAKRSFLVAVAANWNKDYVCSY
jgi:hypothetical protein